ncbi:MAG: pyruvate kinase [Candidatus Omnitrophica bacterium]|nr:pyruvate kinase [Candidatus Omnitrophota bacterium]
MKKSLNRDTGVICTLGPASSTDETIRKMALSGMSVARLNFSHGTHVQHKKILDTIRRVNKNLNSKIAILQDLEGYRIRIGFFPTPKVLKKGSKVFMGSTVKNPDDQSYIPFDFDENITRIKIGSDIFIDDGNIHLKVVGYKDKMLVLEVVYQGLLKQRKGVNIPNLALRNDIMTSKDRLDLQFGIKHKFDYIAQSFVRNRVDIERVVDIVRPKLPECKIVAKIENKEGVDNIDSIIEACDGIMIARGDLGVTLPIYEIPIIQKYIIRRCNRKKKFVVTATQMLESMMENTRPNRAEVSDIANAILDGTDFVMLSGETAVGKYPVKSIQTMVQVIDFTEGYEKLKI